MQLEIPRQGAYIYIYIQESGTSVLEWGTRHTLEIQTHRSITLGDSVKPAVHHAGPLRATSTNALQLKGRKIY